MRIEHVALYVRDLEGARDFFQKYFDGVSNEGYYNPGTNFRSYFLSFSDGSRLELMTKPGLETMGDPAGRFHIAFSVGSKEKVDELTRRLKEDGFQVISGPRTTGDGYYESCVVGPEGNLVEITV